ncbi:hypothetical protein H072_8744 [Dactylellina haptotyla CBS 200.50]|uniref:Uncharacterized protein n=1 Tax=Dactylellina haptotyla (strain CBS 200.50) TaxID=1284197 RepID=S8BE79_DACHA|nr:hypothetical protein H072_8744 [Dactylellina haptotyla CBS 200.50]
MSHVTIITSTFTNRTGTLRGRQHQNPTPKTGAGEPRDCRPPQTANLASSNQPGSEQAGISLDDKSAAGRRASSSSSDVDPIAVEKRIEAEPLDSELVAQRTKSTVDSTILEQQEDDLRKPTKPWYRRNPLKSRVPPPVPDTREISREKNSNILSQLSFWWINNLMTVGYNRPLELNDIPLLPPERRVEPAVIKITEEFKKRAARGDKYPLLMALNHVFFRTFWTAGACRLLGDVLQVLSPQMLRYLITFAQNAYFGHPDPVGQGVGLAVGLLLMQWVASTCISQFLYRGMLTGGMARASLISMIYEKSTVISSRARAVGRRIGDGESKELTEEEQKALEKEQKKKAKAAARPGAAMDNLPGWPNGKVVNLMGTDTYRVDQAASWSHMMWTAPIQVAITIALLIVNLGVSALAGLGLIFLMTPFIMWVVSVLAKRRKAMNQITDKRVGLMQEILQGVRFVKFFAWEESFLQELRNLRRREIRSIQYLLAIRSATNAISMSLPVFASILAFVTYSLSHPGLNPATIFASIGLFNALRLPLNFLPVVISQSIDAFLSLQRIQEYLLQEEEEETRSIDPEQKDAFVLKDASFTWETTGPAKPMDMGKYGKDGKDGKKGKKDKKALDVKPQLDEKPKEEKDLEPFTINNINLDISRNELLAIVGTVGSGKSSLLAALAGDMRKTNGTITQGASMAYCPQSAWIQNSTVRDNILFGRPFDPVWYEKVIYACALKPDLEMLPNGDMTEIGERGITVSGGQKQRLNIARAIYHNSDIILLDDPLSAVDAHVGRHMFNEAISGLLKDKCRVLATHQLHVLNRCDRIIVMVEGNISAIGTFDELMATNEDFKTMLSMTASEEAPEKKAEEATVDKSEEKKKQKKKGKAPGLMQEEERASKSVGWGVYYAYIKASGSVIVAPIVIILLFTSQTTNIMSTIWLSWWTSGHYGLSKGAYIAGYVGLGVAQALFMFIFALTLTVAGTEASKTLMEKAMRNVLRAPMSFFDTTPLGRIINRFSKDVDIMDNNLTDAIRMYFFTLAMVISVFILIIVYLPWFAIALAPLGCFFFWAAGFYRASAREVKRHEAVLRSEVFSRFGEALSGTATIRAYGLQDHFKSVLNSAIDQMDSAYFITFANQRWLSLRLDVVSLGLVFTTAILVVTSRFSTNPSTAGLVLSYILQVVGIIQFMIRQLAEVENAMNSTERIHYYGTQLPQEAAVHTSITPSPTWPEQGEIVFENVKMRYREGLPLVLQGLDLHVRGGERIGVVGRTGAGKSSIMSTLFRLTELAEGKITIDGLDISKIGLQDLRSKLSIIPQDPTLFQGTVRSNLDPFGEHTDLELWDALRQSYLITPEETVEAPQNSSSTDEIGAAGTGSGTSTPPVGGQVAQKKERITLDTTVIEEGLNFSLGQRQLMALARALVRGSRIIVCDEATSSVDEETDRKIQKTMAEGFGRSTVLCIAHRLRTIVKYDRVVVLDQGRIVEADAPLKLWESGGVFRGMCDRKQHRRPSFLIPTHIYGESNITMPKFNPSAAKLLAVESYFTDHRPITAHSIKDLEKALPTATGISGMQVKDYLTALVDENKIRVEKIGSGNWYWSFKADEKKQKENELKTWEREVAGLEARIQEITDEIEQEKGQKEGDSHDKVQRTTMMRDIQLLMVEKTKMESELALHADNNPVQIDHIKEVVQLMKAAGNIHADNIYAIEGYMKGAGMLSSDVASFKGSLGIPNDLEDIE